MPTPEQISHPNLDGFYYIYPEKSTFEQIWFNFMEY